MTNFIKVHFVRLDPTRKFIEDHYPAYVDAETIKAFWTITSEDNPFNGATFIEIE